MRHPKHHCISQATDNGNALLAAPLANATSYLRFSLDEGENWRTFRFTPPGTFELIADGLFEGG